MIKKYVRGDASNYEGVIKALENLGGQNENKLKGCDTDTYYFINSENVIDGISLHDPAACILTGCFKEIQPVKTAPKIITNLDVVKWYFDMIHKGHAVQFAGRHDYIMSNPFAYANDDDETEVLEVRVDFGEWIPVSEAGIK